MVWQVVQAVSIPVIGFGGIMNGRDALEFLIAGASAVQVGTANFVNPRATMDIIDDIRDFMQQQNIPQLNDLVGSLIAAIVMEQMSGFGTCDQNTFDGRAVSADELKGEFMEFKTLDDILEFAISKEVEAQEFYLSLCEEETMSGNRQTFQDFAREEKKHVDLLQSLKTRRGGRGGR